jgi:broad specificity phosphatase PhoE
MLEKKIYFIRHGETILNAKKIRQGEDGGLSKDGVLQAREVGEYLSSCDIKKIFCSPYQRAIETAQEVMKTVKAPIEYNPLLSERRNPSKIVGLAFDDPLAKQAIAFMDKSFHDPDSRWDDEENFQDLKERAIKLRDFLQKNITSNNLCITHGIFLKMFLCVLIHGESLDVKTYVKMTIFTPVHNTSITIVKYKPLNFFSNPWEIITFDNTLIQSEVV